MEWEEVGTSVSWAPGVQKRQQFPGRGDIPLLFGASRVKPWASQVVCGKEPACQCCLHGFHPWVGKIAWTRKWQPTPVFLSGEPHGQRSLAGCSLWCCRESDTTEQLNSKNV